MARTGQPPRSSISRADTVRKIRIGVEDHVEYRVLQTAARLSVLHGLDRDAEVEQRGH